MIIFNILLNDADKAKSISNFVIKEKYALHIHIDNNNDLCMPETTALNVRLYFITKALLYSEIEKTVKEHFYSEDMIIYATPISHINDEFGNLLRSNIKSQSKEVIS